jgi:uncharacterized tellurite resistance protein B-like protein
MDSTKNSQLGLLHLAHILISADGVIDQKEYELLAKIKTKDSIPDDIFSSFEESVRGKKEKEIYTEGIELINSCTEEQKLNAFVHMYKMAEADGRVHAKEVRLLLYTIKNSGIEFNDVVARAKSISDY